MIAYYLFTRNAFARETSELGNSNSPPDRDE